MKKLLTTIIILAQLTGTPALAFAQTETTPETQESILLIPENLEYTNLEPDLLYLLTSETEINQEQEIPILDSILETEENPQAILKYNNSYFVYDKKGRLNNVKTYNTDGTIKSDELRTYTPVLFEV